MRIRLFLLTLVMFTIIGKAKGQYCTPDARYTEVAFFDSSEITLAANVQYGIAQDYLGNPDTLLLDLYYPNLNVDPSPLRPLVLLFHGGGFVSGDKQSGDIRDLCVHLALRGFVTASVNYRLGFDFSEYGQYKARYRAIQDGHAAMRFIVQNASTVRVDTNWLFVGGQSAGSLLALGMVYADQAELNSISIFYSASSVSTELGGLFTSGNALTNTYAIQGIFNNWGGVTESEVDVAEMLPTVAFHGELDTTVLIDADPSFAHYTLDGSRAIHQALIANGICSELTVDTLGGHGIYRNASSVFRAQRASCFFKSVFCNQCSSLYTTDSLPSTCSIPLAADETVPGQAIVVYPNPFSDAFRIEGLDGSGEMRLYNGLGQLVHAGEVSDGELCIDLPPGIYVLQVWQPGLARPYTARLHRR